MTSPIPSCFLDRAGGRLRLRLTGWIDSVELANLALVSTLAVALISALALALPGAA